jgi:uncharacterized protein (DUF2235 family)
MALYAFDGTWNKQEEILGENTNVAKFAQAYQPQEQIFYQKGVGTRFWIFGRLLGGILGAGGRSRIHKALRKLEDNIQQGDADIDIIGFSRGAAVALEFASRIQGQAFPGQPQPRIRFLGLWDTVHSFGVPGNDINLGWQMALADNVDKCFHALALDERRHNFPLTRLAARVPDADQTGRLYEVWFRGVHSDVGGGNRNQGLSDIALLWMMRSAERCGIGFDPAAIARAQQSGIPNSDISIHKFDPIKNAFRVVRWNDSVHASVAARSHADQREHNNPPLGLAVVDDRGDLIGKFGK